MSKLTGEELAKEFDNFCNGSSSKEIEVFVNKITNTHPTIQQNAFGVILKVVDAMSKKKYVDGRNQASKERADWMVEGIKVRAVEKLLEEDSYYWRDGKAKDWVYGVHYDFTQLPFI